jgi:hypothetical protein
MFDTKTSSRERLEDAADLIIDFATLGEYGLEPVGLPTTKPCEARQHGRAPRSTGSWMAAIDHFAVHA